MDGVAEGGRGRFAINQMLELAVEAVGDGYVAIVRQPAEGRTGDESRDAHAIAGRDINWETGTLTTVIHGRRGGVCGPPLAAHTANSKATGISG